MWLLCSWLLYLAALATNSINAYLLTYLLTYLENLDRGAYQIHWETRERHRAYIFVRISPAGGTSGKHTFDRIDSILKHSADLSEIRQILSLYQSMQGSDRNVLRDWHGRPYPDSS